MPAVEVGVDLNADAENRCSSRKYLKVGIVHL